jgi:excisionase family DNA binding protein
MSDEGFLTVKQAAALLAVKPRTIYAWVADRSIPFHKVGRLLRFDRAELLAWAAAPAEAENFPRVVNW